MGGILYVSGYQSTCVKFLQVLIFMCSRLLPLDLESLEFLGVYNPGMQVCEVFSGFEKANNQSPAVMEAGSGPGDWWRGWGVGVGRHLSKSLANQGKHPSVGLATSFSPGCDNRHSHADLKDLLTSHYMCL